MVLAPGSVLGPYEIVSLVGAGGMGQVYRALDTRLGRIVALKTLPPHRAGVGDFADRFEREARAISSLSHPNICALYDVGKSDSGVPYLVMEFLEGETLRDRLRDRISIRSALEIAVQVAHGLAAAHRKALIHRDLKPENIFLTRDGVVKIVDFGLVKAIETADDDLPDSRATVRRTEPGLMVGTAHYVAPEQIRGEMVDHRVDIFSFGIVLYEMLAGMTPFDGDGAVATMAKTLHDEPRPLSELVADLPPGIEPIVARCLSKEPEDRFGSARDLAIALDAISRGSRTEPFSRGARDSRPRQSSGAMRRSPAAHALLGLALLAGLALIIAGGRYMAQRRNAPEPPLARTLTHSGTDHSPAATVDGRYVAFVSMRDGTQRIWLKQLADGTEVALTAGPADSAPRFSPDGASLLFTRASSEGSALFRVAIVGGEPRKVLDNAFDGDFSPDARSVAFIRDRTDADRYTTLCVTPTAGGEVRELASSVNDDFLFPRWSPDGHWLAVTRKPRGTSGAAVLLVQLADGALREVARKEAHGMISSVAWLPDGSGFLFAELEAISTTSLRRRGGPARVLKYDLSADSFESVLWNPHASADTIDLADGRLVYTEDITRHNLQEVALGASGTHWLTRGTAIDRQPTYTADGRRVVFCSDRGGSADLWELELATGGVRRLTDDPAVDWDPASTSDGKLLWSSNRGGHFEVWTANGDGSSARQLSADGVDAENPSTPADAQWIFYDSSNPSKEGLWRMRRDGSSAALVVRAETAHPEVSADGRFIVYHRPAEAWQIVEIVEVATGVRHTLARVKGVDAGRARWAGNTSTVVYEAEDEEGRSGLYVQEFTPRRDTFATRRRLAGFDPETTVETFAISPDGRRAVLSLREPSSGLMIADGVSFRTSR